MNKRMTKIIASPRNWIESDAIEQLNQVANLPGMFAAVGMPDLHPGKGSPIGAAFVSQGLLYPHLIGSDIGCGMSFCRTDLVLGKTRVSKLAKALDKLITLDAVELEAHFNEFDLMHSEYDKSLGTIGGGNHFVELQKIEKVIEDEMVEKLQLSKHNLFLLVHSGSRGLGESILRNHAGKFGAAALIDDTNESLSYLTAHNHALRWAQCNRKMLAVKFARALSTNCTEILDISHNSMKALLIDGNRCWLHRKGAAPADQGVIVIPGSRGSLSYLVQPIGDQTDNLYSLAHGAGRKWKRSDCFSRLQRFTKEELLKTDLGSVVICDDKQLLYEEAPPAYKNIDVVVGDLVDAGLVRILATLAPVLTYKVRKENSL